ncbi:MAG TPA: hypothetical protein VFU82_09195 [Gammaproteobacteria bacterium]|nr:hypothetical protein [Gammaproteobacteria bacterium]
MTVSRYASRHPVFFYHQVKNKIDERTKGDSMSGVEQLLIVLMNFLIERKHFSGVGLLSSVSFRFRHAALQSNLLDDKIFDFYHQAYMNRRNEFDLYLLQKSKESRTFYDQHGSASAMVAHSFIITILGIIMAAFLSTYQQLNEVPPRDACPSLARCDFEKAMKKPPKISSETLFQWVFIGITVGLILSYLARVKMANDYIKNHCEYPKYRDRLFFPKPENLTLDEYAALPRDKKLAEKYVCLMRMEDEHYGRRISK